jgi:hypothetical protein
MDAQLIVESSLEHDGDGCVRYVLSAQNQTFRGSAYAWGNPENHLELADALAGFPTSSSGRVSYSFGTPRSGTCALDFFCTDGLGHLGVWSTFEAEYEVGRGLGFEGARVFLRCEPAAIDVFVASLRRFVPGAANVAVLSGRGP